MVDTVLSGRRTRTSGKDRFTEPGTAVIEPYRDRMDAPRWREKHFVK